MGGKDIQNIEQKKPKEDYLNRGEAINRIYDAISQEWKYEEESFVLSLNSKFGTGKSFFVEKFKDYLEVQEQKVVFINSWLNSLSNDPLSAIVLHLLQELDKWKDVKKVGDKEELQKKKNKAMKYLISIGLQVVQKTSGFGMMHDIFKSFKDSKIDIDGENPEEEECISNEIIDKIKSIQMVEGDIEKLKKYLQEYIEDYCNNNLLYIIIDELDRCKPTYAIEYLEVIRNIFSVKGIVFIIAVYEEQLKSAVKKVYGSDMDFQGYYSKFYTERYNLKSMYDMGEYREGNSIPHGYNDYVDNFINRFYNNFKEVNNIKDALSSEDFAEANGTWIARELFKAFKLTPRDMQKALKKIMRFVKDTEAMTYQENIDQQFLGGRTCYSGYLITATFIVLMQDYNHYLSGSEKDLYKIIKENNFKLKDVHPMVKSLYQNTHNDNSQKTAVAVTMLIFGYRAIRGNYAGESRMKQYQELQSEGLIEQNDYTREFCGNLGNDVFDVISKKLDSFSSVFESQQ